MNRTKTIHCDEYRNLIEQLVFERKRLGLSQLEVAQFAGMTQSEISKIENLERRLDAYEFKLILEAYRVSSNPTLKSHIIKFLGL